MNKTENQLDEWLKTQASIGRLYVHDFKNPVAALSANLSFLQAALPNDDRDVTEALGDSMTALQGLTFMMDNFLSIACLEAGEVPEPQPVSLETFVLGSLQKCRKLIPEGGPAIDADEAVPSLSCRWPTRFARLALENLLMASAHNSPGGGIITLAVSEENGQVRMSVKDGGMDIDAEYLPRSFDREFQTQAKTIPGARYGRAMAMYAVKLGAEACGGSVSIEPNDRGQQFVVTLPAETPNHP